MYGSGIISPAGFVVFFAICLLVQGFICNGLISVVIPSLERRFQLSSAQAGVISSAYDIGFLALSILLPHWLKNKHAPRAMAFGTFGMAIGCFIFALPHYITGPYIYANTTHDLCQLNTEINNTETSSLTPPPGKINMALMVIGGVIMGVANIPAFTVAFTFMEDNISKQISSLCVGIVNGSCIFGVMVGFILGGTFMSLYVDFDVLNEVPLTQTDSRWVGAWWVGFLIAAIFVIVFAGVPLFMFPENFNERMNSRKSQDQLSSQHLPKRTTLLKDIFVILHNKIILLILAAATLEMLVINALTMFLPKFLQNQFNLSGQTSAMLAGTATIPGAVIGHLVSGALVQKYKMNVQQMLKFSFIISLPVMALSPLFFIKCPKMMTDNSSYNWNLSLNVNESSACSTSCNCKDEYSPVCGDDHVTYLSACLAGCKQYDIQNATFTDCDCISSETKTAAVTSCSSSCVELYLFIILLFFIIFFSFLTFTPVLLSLMRIVKASHRPVVLGIQACSLRIFGSIPGPMILGLLIDNACLTWQGVGENKGSCWFYDNSRYATNTFLFAAPIKAVSTLIWFCAFYFYTPQQHSVVANQNELTETDEKI